MLKIRNNINNFSKEMISTFSIFSSIKPIQKRVFTHQSWTYTILICIMVSVLLYIFYFRRQIADHVIERFIGTPAISYKTSARGFCSESAEYVLPVIHTNFITPQETEYILQTAKPHFSESKVVTGSDTNIRKSKTAWLAKTDPTVGAIIQRVCDMTNIPFENAEKMQVVRYEPDGFYNEHHDACCDDREECVEFEQNGGQRKITMLFYLTDDFEGGATRFPKLNQEYKPPKYSGLLFHPLEKNGTKGHPSALHAGLPVTSGEKYIANVWLRETEYDTSR